MPQVSYDQPQWRNGQVATLHTCDIDSYGNELFAQVNTITVGGTTDGDYTIQFASSSSEVVYQVTFAASGNTAAEIASGLVDAINDDPDVLGILSVAYTPATDNFTVTFASLGSVWTISYPSNPGGNLSDVQDQAPGGVDIPVGLGLVQGSTDVLAALPTGASTDDDFVGICVLGVDGEINFAFENTQTGYAPGTTMAALVQGDCIVETEDAVAKNGDVFMRITATVANPQLGKFRSDDDGGNAIQITGLKYRDTTSAAGLAIVRANRPS